MRTFLRLYQLITLQLLSRYQKTKIRQFFAVRPKLSYKITKILFKLFTVTKILF